MPMTVAIGLITAATLVSIAAPLHPAALQALEKQGLTIVGPIASPGGLAGYAAHIGTEPVALYVTPDGKHV
ncbi:MAG: thiol:disulfide interchange protein DsbG, partial [Burkholderiales bacterium]